MFIIFFLENLYFLSLFVIFGKFLIFFKFFGNLFVLLKLDLNEMYCILINFVIYVICLIILFKLVLFLFFINGE